MKIKTIIAIVAVTLTIIACKKDPIRKTTSEKNEIEGNSEINLNNISVKNQITTDFLESEEYLNFKKQNFGDLDVKNAKFAKTSKNNIIIISFPINSLGSTSSKLYVYYRPNVKTPMRKFIGIIESFTTTNNIPVTTQLDNKEITGIFTFKSVNSELITSISIVKNILIDEEQTYSLFKPKPFDYAEWGRCIKTEIRTMGPVAGVLCFLELEFCLTVIMTDCLIEQVAGAI